MVADIDSIPEKIKGDGPVHGATVYIVIFQACCQLPGQGALPAGGVTIYRYYDLRSRHTYKFQASLDEFKYCVCYKNALYFWKRKRRLNGRLLFKYQLVL